jgi:DNA/RNA endonuclease YhcR with UshA esterase domain
MRALIAGVLCLAFWLPFAAADQQKPIAPAEAAKKVNEEVTVLMEVKSVGNSGQVYFLNSEEDFKDPKNFTVFIDKDTMTKFKEAKIDDPAGHFKGKTIQVKGKVILYRERPEIKVSGPDSIQVVEKK